MNKSKLSSRLAKIGACAAFGLSMAFASSQAGAFEWPDMTKGKPFTDFQNITAPDSVYLPLASYRVGPYAAGGTGYYGGQIDVYKWVNMKYGGISAKPGDKPRPIVWDECETEYDPARGVECYERYKNKGLHGPSANDPLSVGIAYAVQEKTQADKIPSITPNHGNTASQDGSIFTYQFPVQLTPYDEADVQCQFIAKQMGGADKLKGKKILVEYHGSAYGRETFGYWEYLSKKFGFELQQIEVAHPGNEQTAVWQKIKRWNPDRVILRGWGVMNPVAMKTAAKVGYPVKNIIGNIWSNSEADVIPAGKAAEGYLAINTQAPGRKFPLVKELWESLYEPASMCGGKKCGDMLDNTKQGTVFYNLGVVTGLIHIESLRTALREFGPDIPLNGRFSRFGLENLNFDDPKLKTYGVFEMMGQLQTSCKDHAGGHRGKFYEWDGKQWNPVSDWITADLSAIWPLIYERSKKYATEQNITPRNCADPKEKYFDIPAEYMKK